MADKMDWVEKQEAKNKEEGDKSYFKIAEGDNRIQLLTHCAPYALKWNGSKYEPAQEGDTGTSIKGVCWVLQDETIKSATLPYTVVKMIRELQNDEDYAFEEFPMPRLINIKAKGAGTKEVEYTVIPGSKEVTVSPSILTELAKKPTPEEMVEKLKGKAVSHVKEAPTKVAYPTEEINPDDIPFK